VTARSLRFALLAVMAGAASGPVAFAGAPPDNNGPAAGQGARGFPGAGRGDPRDARGAAPIDEAQREARRAAHEKLRSEVLDQMRAMRIYKLTEELKLDQATAATVFPILAQFDDRARVIGQERREIGREVFQQTREGAPPNEARLKELINKLLANQAKRSALDDERFKALRGALTPLQQAKLLLLLPRLEDDFRRRIRDAMDAQRRAEGRGPDRAQMIPDPRAPGPAPAPAK
jgi:hypothetical protein